MKVCSITCTSGRHKCIERALKFFLNQDYEGEHTMLIYNNSEIKQKLGNFDIPRNKKIILINNHISKETGEPYKNLGQIYRDAFTYVPSNIEVITHSDDDDTFLPSHITKGISGLKFAISQGKVAYKPYLSWFRSAEGIKLAHNNLEPSVFVLKSHMDKYGYGSYSTEQHLTWYNPLIEQDKILQDPYGEHTLIYDWSGTLNVFKTSGDPGNPNNFENYRRYSADHGDLIIDPISTEEAKEFYKIEEYA